MSPPAIGHRLSWLFAGLALVGLGAVSVAIFLFMAASLRGQELRELQGKAAFIRHVLDHTVDTGDAASLQHKLDDFLVGHPGLQIELQDRGGRRVYTHRAEMPVDAASREASFVLPWPGAGSGDVVLALRIDTRANAALLADLAWALALATLVGAVLMAAGGFRLVRWGLAPLRELARQTGRLSPGRLDQRLSDEGTAQELRPLVAQFNRLLESLERACAQLEGFNADVAHELRTPLATLIARSELDLRGPASSAVLQRSTADNLDELRRLAGIVNDMLFLSRADRGAVVRLDRPASLAEQVEAVVEFHEAALEDAGLVARVEGDVVLPFDRGLMRRALSNLVGNAVRHAEAGTAVVIRIDRVAGEARLTVRNQGEPIPDDALPRVFDRFFRVERSRADSHDHHGLGLAIVAAIARMHGGRPFARCADGVTSMGLVLPLGGAGKGGDGGNAVADAEAGFASECSRPAAPAGIGPARAAHRPYTRAVRRWLVLLLLVITPLQFSWAAVASYCGHEVDGTATHFGHHEAHAHEAQALEASVDAGDKAAASGDALDLDCGHCHGQGLGMFALFSGTPAAAFDAAPPREAAETRTAAPVLAPPERPQWRVLA